MKKVCILCLALCVLLCSCDETKPVETTDTSAALTRVVTTAEETTAFTAEIVYPEPVIVPAVVTADSYEKEAVDAFEGGDFGFTHSVEYPKINCDKPGALALNEKMAETYVKVIDELKADTEDNRLYTISYEYSTDDIGVIFIRITESVGWQYSEGMTTQKIFYYDGVNDKELTVEEYAERLGIDLDKAKENVLYTYELASSYYEDESVITDETGNIIEAPSSGKLYPAKQSSFDFDFNGIEIEDSKLIMHYGGQMYTYHTFEFALDRDTLAPANPHYKGYVMPNDGNGDININFENGEVTSYALPNDSGILALEFSSTRITVKSYSQLSLEVSINGGESYGMGDQMFDTNSSEYTYVFFASEYVPIEELKAIEIIIGE